LQKRKKIKIKLVLVLLSVIFTKRALYHHLFQIRAPCQQHTLRSLSLFFSVKYLIIESDFVYQNGYFQKKKKKIKNKIFAYGS
jgi:hypothetical protein